VCGSYDADAFFQKPELRVVRCRRCSMIYADPVPSEFVSGQYYHQTAAEYYLSPPKLESDYAGAIRTASYGCFEVTAGPVR